MEFTKPTSYEDPRRFPSRVIGFSFQGPRGRAFLPSGSRCLVPLAFAVKDFRNFSPSRVGFRGASPCGGASESPKRVAVSSLSRLCCQRLRETFFRGPRFWALLAPRLAARRRRGPKREAVYAPGRPSGASTFVTRCRFPETAAISQGSDRVRTDLMCSDRAARPAILVPRKPLARRISPGAGAATCPDFGASAGIWLW